MGSKRKIKITVETDEIISIRNSSGFQRGWCARCATETLLMTPERVASSLSLTDSAIRRHVETGEAHLIETPDGFLICLNSLL